MWPDIHFLLNCQNLKFGWCTASVTKLNDAFYEPQFATIASSVKCIVSVFGGPNVYLATCTLLFYATKQWYKIVIFYTFCTDATNCTYSTAARIIC